MRKAKKETTIDNAECALISVDWKGTPVLVKVRELSDLQIQAIGNFSLINLDTDNSAPSKDWRAIVNTLEIQHNIIKAALVSPTYTQIFQLAQAGDFAKEANERFIDIQKDLNKLERGPERSDLEQKAASLRVLFDLVLPNDFTASITEYILGSKRTEIGLVTKDILLNAAILQKKSGGRPSDYCHGLLSDFNKRDIDTRAYMIYSDFEEECKRKGNAR
jgi:hypothetical protein